MNSNSEMNPRRNRFRRRRWLKIPFIIAAIFLVTGVFFYLWNALIPDLFHGPEINYWQAMGLMILSKLLFGAGFKKGGCHHRGHFDRKAWSLTAEEKRKFYESYCGRDKE